MILVKNILKKYDNKKVVNDVSVNIVSFIYSTPSNFN